MNSITPIISYPDQSSPTDEEITKAVGRHAADYILTKYPNTAHGDSLDLLNRLKGNDYDRPVMWFLAVLISQGFFMQVVDNEVLKSKDLTVYAAHNINDSGEKLFLISKMAVGAIYRFGYPTSPSKDAG